MRNKVVSYLLVFCMSLLVVVGFVPTTVQASDSSYGQSDENITSLIEDPYGCIQFLKYRNYELFIGGYPPKCFSSNVDLLTIDQSDEYNARLLLNYDFGVIVKPGVRVTITQSFSLFFSGAPLLSLGDMTYKGYGENDSSLLSLMPTFDWFYEENGDITLTISFVAPSEIRYVDFAIYFNPHSNWGANVSGDMRFCFGYPSVVLTSYNSGGILDVPNIESPDINAIPDIGVYLPGDSNPIIVYLNVLYRENFVLVSMVCVAVLGAVSLVLFGRKK